MNISFRKILVCLVTVFALGAVAASAASADVGQTFAGFASTTGDPFTSKDTSASVLEGGGNKITCKEEKSSAGEVTGPSGTSTVGKVVVKFIKCEGESTKGKCTVKSSKEPAGSENVTTEALKGELGETTQSKEKEVGLLLEPEVKSTGFVTLEGSCLTVSPTKVEGSIAGEVKPVGPPKAKAGELVFTVSAGKQAITEFETSKDVKVKPSLKAFGAITVTENTKDAVEYTEALEVTAGE